jgi:hypothetical protein
MAEQRAGLDLQEVMPLDVHAEMRLRTKRRQPEGVE